MQPLPNAVEGQHHHRHVTFQIPSANDQPAVPLHNALGTGVAAVHENDLDSASEHLQPQTFSSNARSSDVNHSSAHAAAEDAPVIVPLSSLPLGALPDLPADGASRDSSKHHRHGRKPSKGASSISSVSSKTATTGTSRFLQNVEHAADGFAVHVNHPQQVRWKRASRCWLCGAAAESRLTVSGFC
jgi:hypothetical protein